MFSLFAMASSSTSQDVQTRSSHLNGEILKFDATVTNEVLLEFPRGKKSISSVKLGPEVVVSIIGEHLEKTVNAILEMLSQKLQWKFIS